MDILINAPGHNNQEKVKEYYTAQIMKRYGVYPFITKAIVKITQSNNEDSECSISMQVK